MLLNERLLVLPSTLCHLVLFTRNGDNKRLRLGCRKKLVVLKSANSNLNGAMLKTFWFQVSAIM